MRSPSNPSRRRESPPPRCQPPPGEGATSCIEKCGLALPAGWREWPAWSRAFTVIELLIVLMMMGTVAAIGIPAYMDALDRARVARSIGDIAAMQEEVRLFFLDTRRYPNSLAEIGRAATRDPYGRTYVYLNIAGGGARIKGQSRKDRFLVPLNSDFDLYSLGKDGLSRTPLTADESQDDIVRANNGGYIGLGSEY